LVKKLAHIREMGKQTGSTLENNLLNSPQGSAKEKKIM
jgi:hypothetical protein